MKKALLAIFAAIIAVCTAAPTYAAEWANTASITKIYPQANGSFLISMSYDDTHCQNTSTPKEYSVKVGQPDSPATSAVTAEAAKYIYDLVMLALATSKQVRIVFSDATSSCFITRAWVQ